ncbi:MAG: YihY/virulence factor BrkB family protein [Lentisphaeria bacterium]|nr:YihY/virulence factor BrkB family protein [Lentisphaeria bacterium]
MSFLKSIQTAVSDGKRFFLDELWARDLNALSGLRRIVFSLCRIGMIVGRDFQSNRCSLQASGLTYITLVSMVPILAIMFSFSKGLGMQNRLMAVLGLEEVVKIEIIDGKEIETKKFQVVKLPETEEVEGAETLPESEAEVPVVLEAVPEGVPEFTAPKTNNGGNGTGVIATKLPAPMQQVLVNIFTYVEKTSFATLGLVGSLMLLMTVIFSMAKLEDNFNTIWGVRQSRPFSRKISEYLVVLILMPIVFLAATSVNAILSSNSILNYLAEHASTLAWLIRKSLVLVAMLFVAGGFSFFYVFMPNTNVKVFPAVAAGVVTGIMWFAVYWAYIVLQVGLTNYNTIYGTFAAVPFFLGWLYTNWSIILIGAEISFAVQNYRTMHWEKTTERVSPWACTILGTMVVLKVCQAFRDGEGGWKALDFARENGIPSRIMHSVVEALLKAHIILPVAQDSKDDVRFLPGRTPEHLTLAMIEEAFRNTNSPDARAFMRYLPAKVSKDFERLYQHYQSELSNQNFSDLAQSISKEKA